MREGWKCPACKRILSPDVQVCPCSDGGSAEVGAIPLTPVPPGNVGVTPPWRQTATTGTVWPITSTATVTYANTPLTFTRDLYAA